MGRYILYRLLSAVPVVLGITLIVFFIMSLIPGDPATAILGAYASPENVARLNADLGLDKPMVQRYFIWLGNMLTGDFGRSFSLNRPVLDEVLDGFIAAREREGGKLAAAIAERVDGIEQIAGQVRELIPVIREGQRAKLAARLADLPHPVEPGRAEAELVLWLQKLDVDEELDRLASHITEIRRVLRSREPVGRRLDFLLQEFNREANTTGSKSVDSRTSNAAVELKVLIDQIREQVQNIE